MRGKAVLDGRDILTIVSDQKVLLAIVIIGIVLSFASPYFLTYYNIVNIFSFMSIEGVIVIGMAFLIIVGELDLSVGATMALSTILAITFQRHGVAAGVIAGIIGGAAVGVVNGLLVTRLRLSSLAATLGMMVALSGLVLALTKSLTVKGENPSFLLISQPLFLNISSSVVVFIVLVIVFQIVLKRTHFGRNIYAVGGNSTASRLFGIRVDRVRLSCFVIAGTLAGVAGVLLAGKINVASGRLGVNTPLLAITAVLLGGVSLSGGEGSVGKAFLGFLLIAILNNAMVLLRLESYIQDMIRGAILILILVVDAVNVERAKYR
jgi:ribose transport system permease protein